MECFIYFFTEPITKKKTAENKQLEGRFPEDIPRKSILQNSTISLQTYEFGNFCPCGSFVKA